MTRNLRVKLLLSLMLIVSAVVGVLGGVGVALADDIFKDLASGYQYIYAYHSDWTYPSLSWNYFQRNYVLRSADSTQVTLYGGNPYGTYYYSGYANTNDLEFGPLYIADEYNNHNVYYNSITGFESRTINGINYFGSGTSWYYGSLNSTNNYVDMWQYIWYWPPGSPLETVDISLTSFYTGIGTRR